MKTGKRHCAGAMVITCLISAGLISGPWISSFPASVKPAGRVLVLGFKSEQMDDLQDRFLRETLMRDLIKKGFSVVPVMELEGALVDENSRNIRSADKKIMKDLCAEFSAAFAVAGTVVPEEGPSKGPDFEKGRCYIYSVLLYAKNEDAFHDFTQRLCASDGSVGFFYRLSGDIAGKLEKLMAP